MISCLMSISTFSRLLLSRPHNSFCYCCCVHLNLFIMYAFIIFILFIFCLFEIETCKSDFRCDLMQFLFLFFLLNTSSSFFHLKSKLTYVKIALNRSKMLRVNVMRCLQHPMFNVHVYNFFFLPLFTDFSSCVHSFCEHRLHFLLLLLLLMMMLLNGNIFFTTVSEYDMY